MITLSKNNITDLILSEIPNLDSFPDLREKGKSILAENGLPALKEEEYKFTSISKKLEKSISNFSQAKQIDLGAETIESNIAEGFDGDVLVFNNGQFDKLKSTITQTGYIIDLINDAKPELLGTIAKTEKDPFVALNDISFNNGICITIKKNQKIEKPILFLFFNKANMGQVISPRVLIEVEDNVEATFLENTISLDETVYFSNSVTEIKVGRNAHVHYSRLQNENPNAIVVNNFETNIHKDATFTSVVISLSGDMVRNNLSLNLLDSGCVGNMYGLYLLNGKSHVDNHTNVDHTKPHAESNELYKGILADNSRGVFNGKIFVRKDAQKTNAFQQNNNILLSENAIINTKPQLEIWADDVKCSHGCTTGQLDEEALFYLQSRGLGKDQAKGMLLYAFAGEVMDNISDEHFRNYIVNIVQQRLGSNF
ncbi:Fe-S cluster assembly protein SufD [Aquiflexum balticum DSM 16537]|uniref:Fe-S cluster assembly protein SufD n=1 Tax=Aquiflexum balticum DSM 16537 TaxID=758820 RepID=A0A1W2HBF6_9BACT|nr:Fe-S cluster assembly protein SufD [Aquiflexum balticum]SMD46121.1 Fe-S cluster assembly protein SufD [Aquiflexum balticum DSM 16537]